MKGKVKQAVHFVREWIQQDSARFGADSGSKLCLTIKLGSLQTTHSLGLLSFPGKWDCPFSRSGSPVEVERWHFRGLPARARGGALWMCRKASASNTFRQYSRWMTRSSIS